MSEMVERVARKLEPQAWAALGVGDTLAYANRRKSSLRKARLAIQEIREPTDGMKAVEGVHWDYSCHVCGGLKEGWCAMIDEALK